MRAELGRRQSRDDCTESLWEFHRQAWSLVDPAQFTDNWHLGAISEHLEAVAFGQIKRLLINIPPRCSKSSLVCVSFPAWIWAQSQDDDYALCGQRVQFMFASYAQTLSERDSLKTKRLISSQWYRDRWPDVKVAQDKDTVRKFENLAGGYRLATSVGGSLTGEGANIICVDDALNALHANYTALRDAANTWWSESMSTRLNNPITDAKIVVGQRLHEDDIFGHILSEDDAGDYVHLMIPMRYDTGRHCVTTTGWEDPRSEDGELLWPERFPEEEVEKIEGELGPYASAGQLQQMPVPRGGGILRREWWNLWEHEAHPKYSFVLASLDTGMTERTENDPSAMTVWGVFRDERAAPRNCAMLAYAWQAHLPLHMPDATDEELKALGLDPLNAGLIEKLSRLDKDKKLGLVGKVMLTCLKYRVNRLLIENKTHGQAVAAELKRLWRRLGFVVEMFEPVGDKVSRAHSVVPMFTDGDIWRPDRSWGEMVETQCAQFPKGAHDDLVDTVTMSGMWLRQHQILKMGAEVEYETAQAKIGKRPSRALYPMA